MLNRRVTPLNRHNRERCEAVVRVLKAHTSGINVRSKEFERHFFEECHINYTGWNRQWARTELTRVLKLAADHDMIDGDWVGNGYLWSLKPRDRAQLVPA